MGLKELDDYIILKNYICIFKLNQKYLVPVKVYMHLSAEKS